MGIEWERKRESKPISLKKIFRRNTPNEYEEVKEICFNIENTSELRTFQVHEQELSHGPKERRARPWEGARGAPSGPGGQAGPSRPRAMSGEPNRMPRINRKYYYCADKANIETESNIN